MTLKRYVVSRILLAIPTILILLTTIFFLTHIIPGDPVRALVGDEASEEVVENLREKLGFNRPLLVQYIDYISGLLKGDLGITVLRARVSYVNRSEAVTVASMIRERFPTTIELSILAWVLSLLTGVLTGIVSAMNEGKIVDHLLRLFFLFLYSLPLFVIGIFLQLTLGVYLRMFPIFGRYSEAFRMNPITGFLLLDNLIVGNFTGFLDGLHHLILPSVTLAAYYSGLMSRLSRSEMIKALNRMFCLVAEAKGLKDRTIAFRHALRNAALPIFTLSGLQVTSLLTGSILVETIFSLNGLASLFVYAAKLRDYMLIQGCVTVFALIAVIIGILVDIGYYFLDPRVRY